LDMRGGDISQGNGFEMATTERSPLEAITQVRIQTAEDGMTTGGAMRVVDADMPAVMEGKKMGVPSGETGAKVGLMKAFSWCNVAELNPEFVARNLCGGLESAKKAIKGGIKSGWVTKTGRAKRDRVTSILMGGKTKELVICEFWVLVGLTKGKTRKVGTDRGI
jgi:hypothetical protein